MEIDKTDFEKVCTDEIKSVNLKVLKKIDSDIEEILYIVSYCSLHELDIASKIWHACETAGPLFLVRRKVTPQFKLILLNQKAPSDYEEDIYQNQRFELNEGQQFIFFQNKIGVIKGLWISSKEDLKNMFQLISVNLGPSR